MLEVSVSSICNAVAKAAHIVMVVEDELLLRMMMTDILERLGYAVLPAQSGEEAMELMDTGKPFYLLLTDIVMSGAVDGFDLARHARALHPELPIIYSSGYTQYTTRQMDGVEAPILEKLATPAEIGELVSDCLGRVHHKAA